MCFRALEDTIFRALDIKQMGGSQGRKDQGDGQLGWGWKMWQNLWYFLGRQNITKCLLKTIAKLQFPYQAPTKNYAFQWDDEATYAFKELKRVMIYVPILALSNFSLPFVIETDASGFALGVVLSQDGKPIAYYNQKLAPHSEAKSIYEREFMAIVMDV